jgi:hypothetical protein
LAKLQRAEDAKKAMSDYEADAAAVAAKTARLRALRLARDAALPPEKPATVKPKTKTAKTAAGKKKASAASLAEWLDVQGKEGRSS